MGWDQWSTKLPCDGIHRLFMKKTTVPEPAVSLFAAHPRTFRANHYVYPVLSRRSGGISIGINLNLDKVCNFHCVYCQVDRATAAEKEFVGIERLTSELDATI